MSLQYQIFTGESKNKGTNAISRLSEAPPWRTFSNEAKETRGKGYKASPEEIDVVNAALHLRRPILVTGKPGTGKTSLAYAVQYELDLDPILVWSITSKTTLQQGLYTYDAIARLQDSSLSKDKGEIPPIGTYIRLGPLGTAFLNSQHVEGHRPKILLIDEIDKSDIDFPNDLLHIFEEGFFTIPEIARLPAEQKTRTKGVQVDVHDDSHGQDGKAWVDASGKVQCQEFPLVIMTSNNEREFPPAFLRRCLRLDIQPPSKERLTEIVASRIPESQENRMTQVEALIDRFVNLRDDSNDRRELATDQLLNAIQLLLKGYDFGDNKHDKEILDNIILRSLSEL